MSNNVVKSTVEIILLSDQIKSVCKIVSDANKFYSGRISFRG